MPLSEVNNRSEELQQKMIKAGQAEEQDVTIAREVTVIFQNKHYVLRTDGGDLDARNKLTGH